MESIRKPKWPWSVLVPLVVTAGAIYVNGGMFFWGSAPQWQNILMSVGYLLFWGGYGTLCSGASAHRMFCAFGIGTMINGLVALPVVAWQGSMLANLCMGPAILLSVVFSAPVSGIVALLRVHTVQWIAVIVLGAVWIAAGLMFKRKRVY